MPGLIAVTQAEAADLLGELLKRDAEVERLEAVVAEAKEAHDFAKGDLKAAQAERDKLSHEIRNPPPLFADKPGRPLVDVLEEGRS